MAALPRMPSAVGLTSETSELILDCDHAVRNTIENARAPSARLLYTNCWKHFANGCDASGTSPIHCLMPLVLRFLQQLLD